MLLLFLHDGARLRCQHWLAWLTCPFFFRIQTEKEKRVGQMIASVGHHQHAKPTLAHTHTHLLLFQWKTTEAEEKSRAGDIHAPPSCAAMIFQAREAKVGASSSIMTLNCASTVCTVSIYWACGCEMPSDGAEKASCVGDLFRHSPHTLSDPVFSNQTESHRPHQQTKKLNLKRTCNN